ncbi:DUF3892 domain-containing protein [Klebsiella pneumoniae]|nr:DUF3892 domain-containing protein [Klebsiella pneumoniae]
MPVISKLVLVLDIYSSLSLIWRYSYCLVFQGAISWSKGQKVIKDPVNGTNYITTRPNGTAKDNLENLPEY